MGESAGEEKGCKGKAVRKNMRGKTVREKLPRKNYVRKTLKEVFQFGKESKRAAPFSNLDGAGLHICMNINMGTSFLWNLPMVWST